MFGNSRAEVLCLEKREVKTANIRGKLKKKVWIMVNDIVLVGLREF